MDVRVSAYRAVHVNVSSANLHIAFHVSVNRYLAASDCHVFSYLRARNNSDGSAHYDHLALHFSRDGDGASRDAHIPADGPHHIQGSCAREQVIGYVSRYENVSSSRDEVSLHVSRNDHIPSPDVKVILHDLSLAERVIVSPAQFRGEGKRRKRHDRRDRHQREYFFHVGIKVGIYVGINI